MARTVVSLVRSGAGALRATEPVLEANAYAVAADLDVHLVLAGEAVELAIAAGEVEPAELAGVALPPVASGQDLRGLVESGLGVHVLVRDLAERGLDGTALVPGVGAIDDGGLAALLRAADAVVAW